jgi:hypothetical protein
MSTAALERPDHVRDEDMPTSPVVSPAVAAVMAGFPLKCSATIAKLAAALAQSQTEFPKIEKDKEATVVMKAGGKYSYSYADLAAVFDAVMPVLSKNGLSTLTPTKVDGSSVVATTLLLHSSGEWLCGDPLPLPIGDRQDPRSIGSAMSYARRYSVMSLLGLAAADEDDDAEKAGRNGTHPHADRNRQEFDSRQGPKPAQRQSQQPAANVATSPAAVCPESEPKPVTDSPPAPLVLDGATGKIAEVIDLPSGAAWSIKLESGWKCGTRDREAAVKARELMAAGTVCEIAARPNAKAGFAPMLEWIDVVKPEPSEPREPGSDDE